MVGRHVEFPRVVLRYIKFLSTKNTPMKRFKPNVAPKDTYIGWSVSWHLLSFPDSGSHLGGCWRISGLPQGGKRAVVQTI